MVNNYKRVGLLLGIALLFLLCGIILGGLEIEFTSFLFISSAICIALYLPISAWLSKKNSKLASQQWREQELAIASLLLSTLCIFGIGESDPHQLMGILFFIGIQVLMLIINYFSFGKKWTNYALWILLGGIGLALIIGNDVYELEELYLIATLLYCLLLIGMIFRWFFKQIKYTLQLRNERKKTELLHLQSQVNPHFFFNMLNNLYGVVGKDTKKAQALILKLSDMMRYSIYDGQREFVKLSEEVTYLKNYIELHKMRYHKNIEVLFNQEVENEEKLIMPLLFIILLENAFKHGVENLRAGAFVHIALKSTNEEIKFEVENNFDPTELVKEKGIGLNNLRRRLELAYPDRHRLAISTQENIYRTELTLSL